MLTSVLRRIFFWRIFSLLTTERMSLLLTTARILLSTSLLPLLLATTFSMLFAPGARAELSLSKLNSKEDPNYHLFQFDLNSLNELNDSAAVSSLKDLQDSWQSYLTSTDFFANLDKQFLFKVDQYGVNMSMIIDGVLQPNLLRAIVAIYRKDLEIFIQLAPGAIKGDSRQTVYNNMNTVYNCLIQSSIRPQVEDNCKQIDKLTHLDEIQFERLRSSYSRLTRLSHFDFNHRYCEISRDPFLQAQHKAIQALKKTAQTNDLSFPQSDTGWRGMTLLFCEGSATSYPLSWF